MKILVELEFNENDLGPNWMNLDNLEILLYTEASTRKGLLKVISFEEEPPNTKLNHKQAKGCPVKNMCGIYISGKCGKWCSKYPPEG